MKIKDGDKIIIESNFNIVKIENISGKLHIHKIKINREPSETKDWQ